MAGLWRTYEEAMPRAPARPCTTPGCPALTSGGRCGMHRQQADRNYRRSRPDDSFYHGAAWRRLRRTFLDANPLCINCGGEANTVDHIVPLRERPDMALEPTNLRPMCAPCHSRRSAKDGQRWGRGLTKGDGCGDTNNEGVPTEVLERDASGWPGQHGR